MTTTKPPIMPPGTFNSGGRDAAALNDFEVAAPQVFHRVRETTGLPIAGHELTGYRFLIDYRDHRLCVVDMFNTHHKPFSVDLEHERRDLGGSDLLRRAMGRKVYSVIDATAGFGGDAIHLARIGLKVIAIERCPTVAALLADALARVANQQLRDRFVWSLPTASICWDISMPTQSISIPCTPRLRDSSPCRVARWFWRGNWQEMTWMPAHCSIWHVHDMPGWWSSGQTSPNHSLPEFTIGTRARRCATIVYVSHDIQRNGMNLEPPVPSMDGSGSH
jgi:hypothetical protein